MTDAIRFSAQVQKVQNMADGELRVTLSLPQSEMDAALLLMRCVMPGVLLQVAAVAITEEDKDDRGKQREIHI